MRIKCPQVQSVTYRNDYDSNDQYVSNHSIEPYHARRARIAPIINNGNHI